MKNLSLHLLDILENSAKAGASLVEISFCLENEMLEMKISDNGPGFPDSVKNSPDDPYSTTRTERKVGLGLSLLKEAAVQTGGDFLLGKSLLGGVLVKTSFDMSHPDAKPLGPVPDTIIAAISSWPQMDWVLKADETVVLDTREIRKELEGVPIATPEILKFIEGMLLEGMAPMEDSISKIKVKGL